jgi:hypothetical protein
VAARPSKHHKAFKVIPFVGKDNDASGTLFLETSLAQKFLALCEEDSLTIRLLLSVITRFR